MDSTTGSTHIEGVAMPSSTTPSTPRAAQVPTDEQRARRRAKYLVDLLWHAGAFLIINAAFWIMDLTLGAPGIQWAIWVTAPWAFALVFHALAYAIDGRDLERRRAEHYLER